MAILRSTAILAVLLLFLTTALAESRNLRRVNAVQATPSFLDGETLHAPRHTRSLKAPAIVDGTNATSGFDFVALVQYNDGNNACTGSLVSTTQVLTAGHCCYQEQAFPASTYRVLLKNYKLIDNIFGNLTQEVAGGGILRNVNATAYPSAWAAGDGNWDICLLNLTSAVTGVTPLPLVASNLSLPAGTSVTAVGWGVLAPGGPGEDVKNLGSVVKTTTACSEGNDGKWNTSNAPMNICYSSAAGSGGACNGDSGGPVLLGRAGNYSLAATDARASDFETNCNGTEVNINVAAPEIRSWITSRLV